MGPLTPSDGTGTATGPPPTYSRKFEIGARHLPRSVFVFVARARMWYTVRARAKTPRAKEAAAYAMRDAAIRDMIRSFGRAWGGTAI